MSDDLWGWAAWAELGGDVLSGRAGTSPDTATDPQWCGVAQDYNPRRPPMTDDLTAIVRALDPGEPTDPQS